MRSPIYYLLRRWRRFKESRSTWVDLEVSEEQLRSLQRLAHIQHVSTEELAARVLANAIHKRAASDYYLDRWKELSLREKQVTALICYGCTKSMAAARLHLSVETVRTHLKNVLRKFDIHRVEELRFLLADLDFSEWVESLEDSVNN